jgi:hypothetical protein
MAIVLSEPLSCFSVPPWQIGLTLLWHRSSRQKGLLTSQVQKRMSAPTETVSSASPHATISSFPETPGCPHNNTSPLEQLKPASSGVPESPTTARPLDLDDDDVQETGIIMTDDKAADTRPVAAGEEAAGTAEVPPQKPPRPVTEAQKNELILKEAFPSIEAGVIKAVLSAARGQIEPAFQALLGQATLTTPTRDDVGNPMLTGIYWI